MDRFVEWFCEKDLSSLRDAINEYAEKHSLKIISLTLEGELNSAFVLFEGEKSKIKW